MRDLSNIAVTVHPACHYYKLVEGDAIYDPDVYGGQRTAVVTGLAQALGAEVRDYSTWFDCCGFGFRHILVQRDFTRSFATLRKIEVMKEEADPDVVLTHDTGCVTTLDKSQFAAQAHDRNVGVAVLSRGAVRRPGHGRAPVQGLPIALAFGELRPMLEKMGIDHEQAWAEFQAGSRPARDAARRSISTGTTWTDVQHNRTSFESSDRTRSGRTNTPSREAMSFDTVVVIGGGPGGLRAAQGIAEVGTPVVLLERRDVLGGTPIHENYARHHPARRGRRADDAADDRPGHRRTTASRCGCRRTPTALSRGGRRVPAGR